MYVYNNDKSVYINKYIHRNIHHQPNVKNLSKLSPRVENVELVWISVAQKPSLKYIG